MLTKGVPNVDNTKDVQTVLSFCSGYGGIERGLDIAGVKHRVIAYVEIEAFAIANLVSKMEDGTLDPAPIYTDLKTFPAHLFRGSVDLITGGYPCQPFSAAGKRMGKDDPRHLWPYISEHIEAIRPARVFFENVEGHISLGLREVLSDLEERGYNQAWGIFSAREVGAPHQRKRVFIMADSISAGLQGHNEHESDNATRQPNQVPHGHAAPKGSSGGRSATWAPEPNVGRVVNGGSNRVDRLRLLGNGVVPQTAAKAWETLEEELTA